MSFPFNINMFLIFWNQFYTTQFHSLCFRSCLKFHLQFFVEHPVSCKRVVQIHNLYVERIYVWRITMKIKLIAILLTRYQNQEDFGLLLLRNADVIYVWTSEKKLWNLHLHWTVVCPTEMYHSETWVLKNIVSAMHKNNLCSMFWWFSLQQLNGHCDRLLWQLNKWKVQKFCNCLITSPQWPSG